MSALAPLAALPIAAGLAHLLRQQQANIERESRRFRTTGEAEALHDLRVAIRRMRALFAGFAPALLPDTPVPKCLQTLQKTTNHARDLEVGLAILAQWQLPLPSLQQRWEEELGAEYRQLRQQLPPELQALSTVLTRVEELIINPPPTGSLGALAATLAAHQAKRLHKGIKSLERQWDIRRAHKLRIQGKRVRYLIDPFAAESREIAASVVQLKKLQDLLGDYHDLVVLRERIASSLEDPHLPGDHPRQARRHLKQQARRLRQAFAYDYRGKARKELKQHLRQATESLAQA